VEYFPTETVLSLFVICFVELVLLDFTSNTFLDFLCGVYYWQVSIVRRRSVQSACAFMKMIPMTHDCQVISQAAPAKLMLALGARHMITPFILLNGNLASRTCLCMLGFPVCNCFLIRFVQGLKLIFLGHKFFKKYFVYK